MSRTVPGCWPQMYCVDASSPPHVQERDLPTANSFSTGVMLSLVHPLAGMMEPSDRVMEGQDEIDVHTASVWGWGGEKYKPWSTALEPEPVV